MLRVLLLTTALVAAVRGFTLSAFVSKRAYAARPALTIRMQSAAEDADACLNQEDGCDVFLAEGLMAELEAETAHLAARMQKNQDLIQSLQMRLRADMEPQPPMGPGYGEPPMGPGYGEPPMGPGYGQRKALGAKRFPMPPRVGNFGEPPMMGGPMPDGPYIPGSKRFGMQPREPTIEVPVDDSAQGISSYQELAASCLDDGCPIDYVDELMKDLGQVSERLANRNEGHTHIDRLRDELRFQRRRARGLSTDPKGQDGQDGLDNRGWLDA